MAYVGLLSAVHGSAYARRLLPQRNGKSSGRTLAYVSEVKVDDEKTAPPPVLGFVRPDNLRYKDRPF